MNKRQKYNTCWTASVCTMGNQALTECYGALTSTVTSTNFSRAYICSRSFICVLVPQGMSSGVKNWCDSEGNVKA